MLPRLAAGDARGAMGVDYGEYRPGYDAYVIANFASEPDTLLRRDKGRLSFTDVAQSEGIYEPSRALLKSNALKAGPSWFKITANDRTPNITY